jgi:D-glycero-D-manno-heptose 1,7-bisphosphate phosphatase
VAGSSVKREGLRPAVFVDRDGTIVHDRNHLGDPDGLELLPGAAEGLRLLRESGAALVVVTNQSGVARGFFGLSDVERVNERLRELLAAEGVELDGIYVCPHGPDDDCPCRKPRPGLILQAARELGLDLARSFMIGDTGADVEAGAAVGAVTISVRAEVAGAGRHASDLVGAARIVLAADPKKKP